MRKFCALLSFLFLAAFHGQAATTVLIPKGAIWKYDDTGTALQPPLFLGFFVPPWNDPSYPDTTWKSGRAQLGYGDGDEATVTSPGINPTNRLITTYFRTSFNVNDPAAITKLTLHLLRDDGAVVYLNGVEVFRSNMPGGVVSSNTLASSSVEGDNEKQFIEASFKPGNLLFPGINILAVEVHQANATSSDLSFDLELLGSDDPGLKREIYLQSGTPTSVILRWRTQTPTDSVVHYGLTPDPLDQVVSDTAPTTEHEVKVTGLQPSTVYYYSVGNSSQTFASGPEYFFKTGHAPGDVSPIRVWIVGDSGTANASARAVRDAYYNLAQGHYTDLFLMLGDNAYQAGLDTEYQAAVFDMYPDLLRQTYLYTTLGNHETDQSEVTGNYPYHDIFTLPTQGEAGGLASGTEDYYGFDYGNIHFVCLNSMSQSRLPGSPMLTWLQNDLAGNSLAWTIVFFHHPPYTKGSHDSDTENELIEMRENVLPILEDYGVDLVLSGHSHAYERSYLLDGHYGASTTLTPQMKKDAGDGRDDGTGAYTKTDSGASPHAGVVYIVAGSSGQTGGGRLNHPAMFVSLNQLGSLVLDVANGRLDARFLDSAGTIRDHFTIQKPDRDGTVTPPPGENQPPSVALSSPTNSYYTIQAVPLIAEAKDDQGISSVSFFANDRKIGTLQNPPYEFDWRRVPPGTFSVRALATDSGGLTNWSAPVEINVRIVTTPKSPTALAAQVISPTEVRLSWADRSDNESLFQIERAPRGRRYYILGAIGPDGTQFADTTVQPGQQYTYRVRALAGPRKSISSNAVRVTLPNP